MFDVIVLTLIVNISSTIIAMIIGVLLAYQLYFSNNKLKPLFIYINKTMMGLPPVVLGLLLFMLLKANGPLGFMHLLYQPISLVIAQTLLIIPIVCGNTYQLLMSKGEVLFFTLNMFKLTNLNKIKFSLLELKNDLIFILILGFSRAVSEVGAVMVVGGNIKDHTRIMTTALANLKSMGNYNEALIYGFTLLLIAFIIQYILSKLSSKDAYHENF